MRIFSIGPKNTINLIDGTIQQHVVKGIQYPEEGIGVMRVLDFTSLYLFGFKPTIKMMNNNKELLKKLARFSPDIVYIGSIHMNEFISKYKHLNNNVKVMNFTDSPQIILNSFNSLEYIAAPDYVKNIVKGKLKKKYLAHNMREFDRLLELSDVILVPTMADKADIVKRMSVTRNRIFVTPPIMMKSLPKSKKAPQSVKKAIFIGAAGFQPNEESISTIREIIAPAVPKVKFIVVGKGLRKQKVGNFEILGEITDIESVLKTCDLCVAPIMQRCGIKQKVFTCLSHGIPVLGTPGAFDGYAVKDRINALVEINVKNFPNRIRELQKNQKLLKKITENTPSALEPFLERHILKDWKKIMKFAALK